MNAYIAHIRMNLRLTFRDRTVIFFNYLFPLIFFFMFAQLYHAEQGGAINQVVNMVMTIGVLGTGFFGAGIRAVMDREQNILRRFKVAPISAGPIIVSSLITGLINYMPVVVTVLVLSHFVYGMAVPERLGSLLLFLSIGVIAFRAIGMMVAAVVNSMQESQIIVQLLYFPMLMLSGATIPASILPNWVQIVSGFLPATYLFTGMQSILLGREGFFDNLTSVAALVATTLVASLLAVKLFRWEKEEKMKGSAKLWLLAVLAPFVVMGVWQGYSKDNIRMPVSIARALEGAEACINAAAVVIESGRQKFQSLHVMGARNIAESALAHGVTRFVHISALGAGAEAHSKYGRTKAAGEAAVREVLPSATIVRPSIVFGQDDHFFNRFAALASL
ncbi:MAG: ABC transporter permease, partial [Bryobacteraceae bacterium]